jgi:hypothetical protein
LTERGSGPSAHRRPRNAVEVVPVLLESGSEAGGTPLKTERFLEELPGSCFLTLVAGGEPLERDLLPSDEVVEARHFRRHVGFPALLGLSLTLDAAVEVLC